KDRTGTPLERMHQATHQARSHSRKAPGSPRGRETARPSVEEWAILPEAEALEKARETGRPKGKGSAMVGTSTAFVHTPKAREAQIFAPREQHSRTRGT